MESKMKEEAKFTAHSLSETEIEELLGTVLTLGVIFKAEMRILPKVMKFIEDNGGKIIFRKTSRDKLIISVQANGSGVNASSE